MFPLIIAHRTCPKDAPENSLEGIERSAALGADGVEIDLRLSLDQRPFLMHDWTMSRTTGWPLPMEMTPGKIVRRQELAGGGRVPSLNEALDALPPEMLLAVDVKTPWAIRSLIRAIKRRGMERRVLVWCTSARAVRYAVRQAPMVEVAYLKDVIDPAGKLAFLAQAAQLGARAVSAHWHAIDEEFVAAAHHLSLRVYSYHQEFALDERRLTSGLDGVITDYPDRVREAIATP